mmetsp:Transcript_47581/g.111269  ORF Transcript_47581/g.111269 Transcript_47581/m.111269 type:complete len:255 (-) Transcript_47581:273-1037(-)
MKMPAKTRQDEPRVYQFMHGDEIVFEASAKGDASRVGPEESTHEEAFNREISDDLEVTEVPGIRAVRAFFRKRPASAPAFRVRCSSSTATRSVHVYNFVNTQPRNAYEAELLHRPTPPPVVRPIQSSLDRRRKSLAGRRGFRRPASKAYPKSQGCGPNLCIDPYALDLAVPPSARQSAVKQPSGPKPSHAGCRPASAGARIDQARVARDGSQSPARARRVRPLSATTYQEARRKPGGLTDMVLEGYPLSLLEGG